MTQENSKHSLERQWVVEPHMLASAVKSGTLAVLSTPAMIAMMENTAESLAQPLLDEGMTTVGTVVQIKHLQASPPGATITVRAELLERDGRRFVFTVQAFDEAGLIGEGTHERAMVSGERLEQKAAFRKKN